MGCILAVPSLRAAFDLTVLSGAQWAIVAGLALMSIIQMEIWKGIRLSLIHIWKFPAHFLQPLFQVKSVHDPCHI